MRWVTFIVLSKTCSEIIYGKPKQVQRIDKKIILADKEHRFTEVNEPGSVKYFEI